MKIEFLQDPNETDVKLLVVSAERNEEVSRVIGELERTYLRLLNGYEGDRVVPLSPSEILRVYAERQRVYCQTSTGNYLLHARLYEIEQWLDPSQFVRISKCELINKAKIVRLDVSLSGTVGVILEGNVKTYTSRRFVAGIKAMFGL